eukprot:8131802-Alexandrium_andersonii.AAC.1
MHGCISARRLLEPAKQTRTGDNSKCSNELNTDGPGEMKGKPLRSTRQAHRWAENSAEAHVVEARWVPAPAQAVNSCVRVSVIWRGFEEWLSMRAMTWWSPGVQTILRRPLAVLERVRSTVSQPAGTYKAWPGPTVQWESPSLRAL